MKNHIFVDDQISWQQKSSNSIFHKLCAFKDMPDVMMFYLQSELYGDPLDRKYQTIDFATEVHGTGSWQRCKTCGISNLLTSSMGLVYLPTWMVDFYGIWVGKFWIVPWMLWKCNGWKHKFTEISSNQLRVNGRFMVSLSTEQGCKYFLRRSIYSMFNVLFFQGHAT